MKLPLIFAETYRTSTLARRAVQATISLALCVGFAYGVVAMRRAPAPDVSLTTLEGRPIALAGHPGQVTIVNFWSTSCAPCLHDMPELASTYRRFAPDGLQMVAVAMQSDAPSYVVDYATSRKLPFPVALDLDGQAALQFGHVEDTPTTFVIDKHGRVVKRYDGTPDFAALRALIQQQLAT